MVLEARSSIVLSTVLCFRILMVGSGGCGSQWLGNVYYLITFYKSNHISLQMFEPTWSKTTSSQTRETRETSSNQNPSEKSVHQAAKLSGPVRPRSGPGFIHVSPAFLMFENVETWLLPAVLEIGHQVPASCHILGERRKYSRRRHRVEKCKFNMNFVLQTNTLFVYVNMFCFAATQKLRHCSSEESFVRYQPLGSIL